MSIRLLKASDIEEINTKVEGAGNDTVPAGLAFGGEGARARRHADAVGGVSVRTEGKQRDSQAGMAQPAVGHAAATVLWYVGRGERRGNGSGAREDEGAAGGQRKRVYLAEGAAGARGPEKEGSCLRRRGWRVRG